MIKMVTQGEDRVADKELYAAVGEWITSAALADKLGMPIHSTVGDVWHVAIDKNGDAVGFVLTRPNKNGKGHIRFLYAVDDNQKVQAELLKAAMKMAKDMGLSTLYTNDRESAMIWVANGFKKVGARPNSTFVRFEKVLEVKS